jgi:hypothetical protein
MFILFCLKFSLSIHEEVSSSSLKETINQRRMKLARSVALDAKFLRFTKKLATNSAILIPLRTPQAPLEETEEEHDIIRKITSQGKDFEKFAKYKKEDRFAKLVKYIIMVLIAVFILSICIRLVCELSNRYQQ